MRALLTVLALCLTGPALAAPVKSLIERTDILGWEAVGRIDHDRYGGTCSGALIGPRLVLTAAHCLFEQNGDRRDPTKLSFQAGYRDGETIATARIVRAVVSEGFDRDDEDFVRFLTTDIALLELAEPIPATVASPFAVDGPRSEGARVTVVSFGATRMEAASRQSGCEVMAHIRGVMAFDCDGEPGSSGAPIFDTSGYAPRIVSLISSGGPFRGKDAVFGGELPKAVAELKAALRAGRGVWPVTEPVGTVRRLGGSAAGRDVGEARFLRP